jgi:hypothetical protein
MFRTDVAIKPHYQEGLRRSYQIDMVHFTFLFLTTKTQEWDEATGKTGKTKAQTQPHINDAHSRKIIVAEKHANLFKIKIQLFAKRKQAFDMVHFTFCPILYCGSFSLAASHSWIRNANVKLTPTPG